MCLYLILPKGVNDGTRAEEQRKYNAETDQRGNKILFVEYLACRSQGRSTLGTDFIDLSMIRHAFWTQLVILFFH